VWKLPTASQLVSVGQATPSTVAPTSLGLGMNCSWKLITKFSASVWSWFENELWKLPAAVHTRPPGHDTPLRTLESLGLSMGVGSRDRFCPSQISATAVWIASREYPPTASQVWAPGQFTANSSAGPVRGRGVLIACSVQRLPFHRSAFVPTAVQALGALH